MKQDRLQAYRAKRRFTETPEPLGGPVVKPGYVFLVQKHDARRLHYDFRLELDGVLSSWAVTKGPSYNTNDKRLSVRTEDHPLDYANFEGTIPQGNYGAGTIMLWDTGTWEPVGDAHAGLAGGKLVFILHGKRLHGRWALIRLKQKPRESRENWLLIKEKDEYANSDPDLLARATTSVVSQRDMSEIAGAKSRERQTAECAPPGFIAPMLATLVDAPPTGEDWQFEIKFDGYRAQIAADGDAVRIFSRSGLDWTDKFSSVAKAAATLNLDRALIDGEIVVLDAEGRSDFTALVAALDSGGGKLSCFAFDLLEYAGETLTGLPLTDRKAALKKRLGKPGPNAILQYSEDFFASSDNGGERLWQTACTRGLEGIIAKQKTSTYRSGRGGAWLKIKCRYEQEFLILGFSASTASRPFASLLMGVHENGTIRYAGRVGTGFDARTLAALAILRDRHRTPRAPAVEIPGPMKQNVTWVKPAVVANVVFAGWTGDGQIRHGSFLGLRDDKKPDEVKYENPNPVVSGRSGAMSNKINGIAISHGAKILYADAGVTKAEIAAYVYNASKLMLPYVENRFISLVRAPAGAEHKTFFQRHLGAGFGDSWLHAATAQDAAKTGDYIYFRKPDALVIAVQMNVLEFHIWGSRVDKVDLPDRIVFDLDPDPTVDFAKVRQAAIRLRDVLEALDLASLPMLTGGKGIHVIVPIRRHYEWPIIKAFAANLANRLVADAPDRYIATMSKAQRKHKIFIDHFRNERGATAIAPYSPRARPGAPVAWPLDWSELDDTSASNAITIREAVAAIAGGKSGWARYPEYARQALKVAALKTLDVNI